MSLEFSPGGRHVKSAGEVDLGGCRAVAQRLRMEGRAMGAGALYVLRLMRLRLLPR